MLRVASSLLLQFVPNRMLFASMQACHFPVREYRCVKSVSSMAKFCDGDDGGERWEHVSGVCLQLSATNTYRRMG